MRREPVVGHKRMTAIRLGAVLAGLSIFGGCGQSQETQEQPAFQPLVAHEEFVIDGYDADLVPISSVAVSPDDRILVVQPQESSIRVFDVDGTDLRRIGGPGEGPGEFGNIYRMGFIQDTLWVLDGRLGRVSFYSPNLDLVRTEFRPGSRSATLEYGSEVIEFRSTFVLALLPDGSWNSRLLGPRVPAGSSFDASLVTRGNVDTNGTVLRLVARYPEESRSVTYRRDGAVSYAGVPFPIEPFYAFGPGGRRFGLLTVSVEGEDAGTIQVTMWDSLGDTIYSRRYPVETVPLPRAVADSAVEARASGLDRGFPGSPARPGFSALYRREAWTPPVYPPIEEFLVGRDGSAWIRHYQSGDSASVYRILDPSGEPYGQVFFPRDVSIEAADLNSAWGVFADELDVESVVRYSISAGGGG